jgi:hypothetical protein
MEKHIVRENGVAVAVIQSDEIIISDAQSALDLLATVDYYDDCQRIAINKEAVAEDFFRLSSGLAGEILQKFVNYSKKLAIIGDFSCYTSKPLRDFIYESNQGNAVFFVGDEREAVRKLAGLSRAGGEVGGRCDQVTEA